MDFGTQYGRRIEEFLESNGEVVQRISINDKELEDNYLIDKDGVITLLPKVGGQPPVDSTIVDLQPPAPPPSKEEREEERDPNDFLLPWNNGILN
eukprot:CAMPEP_0119040176 /NCGR_PEP_ID=MMETSP1177-20130426/10012_1 /TAXON_ID=2985 /ORGANISM="Ochromonas sp, Strain CCMP1899" /LENGTH=94 /DNA_ID=CAMNT_0007004947 /DNA_START=501 /DNA_END=785 /DNA_ORIENTATION=+